MIRLLLTLHFMIKTFILIWIRQMWVFYTLHWYQKVFPCIQIFFCEKRDIFQNIFHCERASSAGCRVIKPTCNHTGHESAAHLRGEMIVALNLGYSHWYWNSWVFWALWFCVVNIKDAKETKDWFDLLTRRFWILSSSKTQAFTFCASTTTQSS